MRFFKAVLAVSTVAVALPALASAQTAAAAPAKIDIGHWTGTVTTPDGQTVEVSYEVTAKSDTTLITINAGQFGSFPAAGLKIEAAKITFSFTPGPQVLCVLNKKDDGSFAGECTDDGGAPAQMTMVPPKKAGSGN